MHAGNVLSPQCGYHDAVNRMEIRLTARVHAIPRSNSSWNTRLKGAPVYDAVQRVAEAMVAELTVHAVPNVDELFVKVLFVLQTNIFLESGLVTWLYDLLAHASKMSVFFGY